MKGYWKVSVLCIFVVLLMSSCISFQAVHMTSDKMNRLELGMTKEQVTQILGSGYIIAEKRMEEGDQIEVLSYRDFYKENEFYLFLFKNNKLEKWYRELPSIYEVTKPQVIN